MIDIERFSDWSQACTELKYGERSYLIAFIERWGVESAEERRIVADALASPSTRRRVNATNVRKLADYYSVAKYRQKMLGSAGVRIHEKDVIETVAAWLHKTPESINTLLHRHRIKGR